MVSNMDITNGQVAASIVAAVIVLAFWMAIITIGKNTIKSDENE